MNEALQGGRAPRSLRAPLAFDIVSARFKDDPAPTFARMRAAGPVIPIRMQFIGRAWVTTTYEATLAMVQDSGLFVQERRNAGKSGVAGLSWWMPKAIRILSDNMLRKDEPDHRRLRKLVDGAFARRDILAMRPNVEKLANGLLDRLEGKSDVDLVEDYARRLPMAVICDLLGVPDADRAEFSALARQALAISSALGLVLAIGPLMKLLRYGRRQIEAARLAPRSGLIGELVRAEEAGDRLDEYELLSMILLLLIAGSDTTRHLIADSVIALDRNPEQKAWLLADPAGRMERAVEELARHASPVQSTNPRVVSREAEFFGAHLRRGDTIMALLASANFDPAQFDDPDELCLDRFPNPHLVFSSGVHFCLGMQLARLEAQSALARLYARFPDLGLADPARIEWLKRLGVRGPRSLSVRLRPDAGRLAA
ncbi:MAG: cytochrome P450 [Caulobacteraceae bacterium]